MTLSFDQIGDTFARRVDGMALWQLQDEDDVAVIRKNWREAGVLVFHRQCLSEEELSTFSSRLGKPEVLRRTEWNSKHNPTIVLITNLRSFDGEELGALGSGEIDWHTDQSYVCQPATGAILHGVEVPPNGTPTYFANLRLAYAELDAETKERIEGCEAVYDYVLRTAGYVGNQPDVEEIRRKYPRVTHPLVNADPISGERALYLDPATMAGIVGWPDDEARAVIDQLIAHVTQDKFVYRHTWQTGDVVMWDNGQMLHRRDPVGNAARLMKRATVQLPADLHRVPSGRYFEAPVS